MDGAHTHDCIFKFIDDDTIMDLCVEDVQTRSEEYKDVITPYGISVYTVNRSIIREALQLGFNEMTRRRCN